MISGLLRRSLMLVALVVMWIALWGDLSIANIVGGGLIAVAVLAFAGPVQPGPLRNLDVVAALRYVRTFVAQLMVANWDVAKAVVDPSRIKPGIIAMPLRHASDAVVTLVANSITLTPGTLTLETERRGDVAILYVHSLDVSDADSVRRDIAELELRAVDAFAGPDTQALQARSLAELEAREEAKAPSAVVWPDDDAGKPESVAPGGADADHADADHADAGGADADHADADHAADLADDRAAADAADGDLADPDGADDADDAGAGGADAADSDADRAGADAESVNDGKDQQ